MTEDIVTGKSTPMPVEALTVAPMDFTGARACDTSRRGRKRGTSSGEVSSNHSRSRLPLAVHEIAAAVPRSVSLGEREDERDGARGMQ